MQCSNGARTRSNGGSVREGRGQGSGSQYRPWLTVHDLSSRGRCHRAWCDKVGRQLELHASDIAAMYGTQVI